MNGKRPGTTVTSGEPGRFGCGALLSRTALDLCYTRRCRVIAEARCPLRYNHCGYGEHNGRKRRHVEGEIKSPAPGEVRG